MYCLPYNLYVVNTVHVSDERQIGNEERSG